MLLGMMNKFREKKQQLKLISRPRVVADKNFCQADNLDELVNSVLSLMNQPV